jgi:cysteine-rich repeat protein
MGTISYLFHFLPTGGVDSFSTLNIKISQNRVICFAQCPEGTFIPSTVYTYICEQCQDYMPYCQNCYNSTYCKECQSIAVPDIFHASCLLCSSFMKSCRDCDVLTVCLVCYVGEGVIGGCTDVPGCAEVEQMMTSTGELESYCVRCDEGYSLEGQTCVCDEGESVGLYCTDTAGCVSTVKVNSEVVCVFCNVSAHFQIDSNTHRCLCVDGYEIVGRSCSDVCGDGRVFSSECDDGNTADGDGCSSSCSLEPFHKCFNGSQSSPSSCQYVGENLDITLVDTHRTEGSNQGVFSFAFAPPMPLLGKFNISDYFFFDCSNASFTVASWTYSDGVATALVDFQTDLEDRAASVNFTFHQLYIRHSPILLEFTVQSKGVLLVVADTSLKAKVCLYFFMSVSFFSVFLVLVGSFAHQMAGVELVHALQVVYYLHYTTTRYSPALSSLQEMSIVALDDLFLGGTSRNVLVDESLQKIDFSMRSAELTILGVSLVLAVLGSVVLTLLLVFLKCEGSPKTEKAGLWLYRGLLFPLCLSVMLPTFFVALSFTRNTSAETLLSDPVRSLLVFTALTILSLVFFNGFIKLFITTPEESSRHNEIVHYLYIPVFEIFIFLEMVLFALWSTDSLSEECPYILLLLTFCHFVLILKWNPYQRTSDNVGILISVGLSLSFQFFLILRRKGVLAATEEFDVFCLMIIAIIMAVCSVLSVFRLAFAVCSKCESPSTEKKEIPPNKGTFSANLSHYEEIVMRNHIKNQSMQPAPHFISSLDPQQRTDSKTKSEQTKNEKDSVLKQLKQSMIEQYRRKKMYNKRAVKEEIEEIREGILR